MTENEVERFVAENVTEAVWLRLRRLTSAQLCEQLLCERTSSISADIIRQKSIGMSSAIRSALGYWDTKEGGINSKILSRYYALLQITFAEQISSLTVNDDLAAVQRHTEQGHGLFTVTKPGDVFPANFYLGCLNSGHFAAYTRSLGIDLAPYFSSRRPKKFEDAEVGKLISLTDLLRRIPELQNVIKEYTGSEPLSFHVGHDYKNYEEKSDDKTYVAIYHKGASISAEDLYSFGFGLTNIQLVVDNSTRAREERFVGEVMHSKGSIWWEHVETYKSGYSVASVVAPALGTRDPFVMHFAILYAFSILVRYLPETWHSIEHGKLDNVRALLEHYLVIVDNVLPHLAVERLTKKRLLVTQPGSLFSQG